jgi:rhamnosyltransferase
LNASETIGTLLDSLETQTVKLEKIIVIDSSSTDDTVEQAVLHHAQVIVIPRSEFDHGATRHKAFMETSSDFVLFMTQDALPANDEYVERLIEPFTDSTIGMVSGRQIPRADARLFEKMVRRFNYPSSSYTRHISDVSQFGIKTFFASDVCSAYRRSAYLLCGGFERPCNTNEDMLMCAAMLRNNWLIRYAADAEVIHSHTLTFTQQYRRNKEIGFFLATHKEELRGAKTMGEGLSFVTNVELSLFKRREFSEMLLFPVDCAARFFGNMVGKIKGRKVK